MTRSLMLLVLSGWAALHAAEPGKFDYDELRVELTMSLDGQPFIQKLDVR